jgi:hypothetical protein
MEPREVHQQMHHYCERQQAQADQHAAEVVGRLAQHTTQKADHDGAIEVEQAGMMGDRCVAEPANINATASTSTKVEVTAVAITQGPTAPPRSTVGGLCGNTPEGPPQYDGRQTKAWKPGYSL